MLDLALRVIYFSLRDEFFCETLTFSNQGVTLLELITLIRQRSTKRMFRKKEEEKKKKKYDEKSFMWLTACVLFCHTGAVQGGGRGKMHFLFPSIN